VLKDTNPLDTKPTVPFRALLRDIALGITDDETLRSAAVRLVRLDRRLSADEREEFAGTAGGATMTEIASDLRKAADPDHQLATARSAPARRSRPLPSSIRHGRVSSPTRSPNCGGRRFARSSKTSRRKPPSS